MVKILLDSVILIDHLNGILFTDRVVNIKTLRKISPETDEEEVRLLEV